MRTIVDKAVATDSDRNYRSYQEIMGKSGETKPITGLVTGSSFLEVDTGDLYFFDEDASAGEEWIKQ